ncbi:MAG: YeiH family putative sulfate export transporter [Burkholderiaceae bacterium]|nr:YeiH family putative sulfate export transporter [Burkholderiaceae bacterium]
MNAPTLTSAARYPVAQYAPGLLLCLFIAGAAMRLGQFRWLAAHGFSALTVAIVFGMVLGNTLYPSFAASAGTGVTFAKQMLLRAGIVLYGLRLTLQDISHVGTAGVLIDALVVCSTFGLACLLGTRVFRLDRTTAMLVGAGSAICGAAAVMATEPVLKAQAEKVTVAVSTVVVFGTCAIFIYPALFALNQHWGVIAPGAGVFGIYAGSTIHEVAQVVAAAHNISAETADVAVIAKMVRVMLLAPFLITLSSWLARETRTKQEDTAHHHKPALNIPWFAFIFIAVVVLHSLVVLPAPWIAQANDFDTVLLAMAMAALGLTTHVSGIRQAGVKPLLLGAVLFVWLIVGGAFINRTVFALL